MKRVLIAGATGVIGREAARSFQTDGWDVSAVSRRVPDVPGLTHIGVDLRDRESCSAALSRAAGITHVVYAALYEKPGLIEGWLEADQMSTNAAMLDNLMSALDLNGVEHVSLLQGAKAYGGHVHPIPIPAKPQAARDPHDNFYWLQEDLLKSLAKVYGFAITILRPQLLIGGTVGSAMNIPPVIGVYGAICREEGLPFAFTGGAPFVWEAVDSRLCGEALLWAASNRSAWGQTFNITNGDAFAWRDLWPQLAEALRLQPALDQPMALSTFLPEHSATWDRIVERYGLRAPALPALLGESHHYADFCFNYGNEDPWPPIFLSTISLRQAGFGNCYDTADSFTHWLDDLARRRILPPV